MKKLLLIIPAVIFCFSCTQKTKNDKTTPSIEIVKANFEYGYDLNEFTILRDTIRSGDTFGAILDANHVSQGEIYEVVSKIKDSFDVRRVKAGNPYVLLNSKDSIGKTQVFIYEKNTVDYAVIDLRDCVTTFNDKKPVSYIKKYAKGVITSSLSETMEEQHLSPNMTDQLADIYAWTIDFFRLQPGDRFKVVYTEKYINDSIPAGLGEIKAVMFEHRGKPIYAFSFIGDSIMGITDYYDDEANNLRRAFLKAPVKFSRISSRYNLKRKIKFYGNRVRAHKGTDFAAPMGTPIMASGDGVVVRARWCGGGGNCIKIKHNSTYQTIYAHMKNFAKGIKEGVRVKQGQVIGYVGSTGKSTGPHLHYEVIVNGKKINSQTLKLPSGKILKDNDRKIFEVAKIKLNVLRSELIIGSN